MRIFRVAILTLVVVVVGGLARWDSTAKSRAPGQAQSESSSGRYPMPVTGDSRTIDAVWYCAAAQVRPRLESAHAVIITNPGDQPTRAVVAATAYSNADLKKIKPKSVDVAPHSVVTVSTADLGTTGPLSLRVEVLDGLATVEHRLTTAHGTDQKPCSSRVAPSWHFAFSNTEKDATARLFVYNPLPVRAIVSVTTSTPESVRVPDRLQGIMIAPGTAKELNVNANALRWPQVGLSVEATTGLVVAELVQFFDESNFEFNQKYGEKLPALAGSSGSSGASGASGPSGASGASGTSGRSGPSGASGATGTSGSRLIDETTGEAPFTRQGLAIVPGVPVPVAATQFLDGYTQNGVREWLYLYNPGRESATVQVRIVPLGSSELVPEPIEKTVPPGRVELVKVEEDKRIPAVGFHRIETTTLAGANVVGSLVHMISDERPDEPEAGQLRPGVERGLSISAGSPLEATRWLVPTLDMNEDDEGWIFVHNASPSTIALVTVSRIVDGTVTPLDGLNPIELPANTETAIEIQPGPPSGFLIESEQPVIVERRWVDSETEDVSTASGVPSASGAEPIDTSAVAEGGDT